MLEFKINSNEKIVVTEKSNCYGEQWWLVQYCSGSTLFTLDTETKHKRAIGAIHFIPRIIILYSDQL